MKGTITGKVKVLVDALLLYFVVVVVVVVVVVCSGCYCVQGLNNDRESRINVTYIENMQPTTHSFLLWNCFCVCVCVRVCVLVCVGGGNKRFGGGASTCNTTLEHHEA